MSNGRCRMHGGSSLPPGPNNPNWKHGFYSKAVPERLRDRIAAADNDPAVLSHRRDLALLDARLEELLERLTEGGSANAWHDLGELWTLVEKAREDGEKAKGAELLLAVGAVIRSGVNEEAAWSEARAIIRDRRDQATHEHKRTLELSTAIRPDELAGIIARIAFVIRREVSDEETRRRISVELERLSNAPEAVN